MIISYKYDWDKIKAEYETGQYTLKQLADKHGQSKSFYSYLRQKASEENWKVNEKVSRKLAEKIAKKVVDNEANREVELREEYEKILNEIKDGVYDALFIEKDFSRLKQFKIASEIVKNLRKEHWEIHEIQEIDKKVKNEIKRMKEENKMKKNEPKVIEM